MIRIFGRPSTAEKSARIVSFLSAVRRRLAAPRWRFNTTRQSPSINPHAYPDAWTLWNKLQDKYSPDTPVPTQEQLEAAGVRVQQDLERYGHFVHQRLLKRGIEDEVADSAVVEACFALTWEYAMGNRIPNPGVYMVFYALSRLHEPDCK